MSRPAEAIIPIDLLPYYPPQKGLILKSSGKDDLATARVAQLTYACAGKNAVAQLCETLANFNEQMIQVTSEKSLTETLFDLAADARKRVEAAKEIQNRRLRHSSVEVGVRRRIKHFGRDFIPDPNRTKTLNGTDEEVGREKAVDERFGDTVYPAMLEKYNQLTDAEKNNNSLPDGDPRLSFSTCEHRSLSRDEQNTITPTLPYGWKSCLLFIIIHPDCTEFRKLFRVLDLHLRRVLNTKLPKDEKFFESLAYLAWGLVRMMPLQAGSAGTTELLVKAILLRQGFQLPALKDTHLTWDWLAVVLPAEKFAPLFMDHLFIEKPKVQPAQSSQAQLLSNVAAASSPVYQAVSPQATQVPKQCSLDMDEGHRPQIM